MLQGQSPYYVLHQKLPDITTFKVFSCLCHASYLQSHRTKLQTIARKTVFLGYMSGYKGFILLDIHFREIFISKHVVFHEHFLPYPSNNESITTQWDYFSPVQPVINETIDTSPHPPIIDDDDYSPIPSSPPTLDNKNSPPAPLPDIPPAPPLHDIHQSPRKLTRNKTALVYLQVYVCNNLHVFP